MDAEGNAMTRLLHIQNNLRVSEKIDDIFEISYIYSTLERFIELWNVKVVNQCLNMIQEALKLMESNPNDVFESQMPLIIRSVVRCLDISDVSNEAEVLLQGICEKENYASMVRNQIQEKSEFCTPSHVAALERILRSVNLDGKTKPTPKKAPVPPLRGFQRARPLRVSSRDEYDFQDEDEEQPTFSNSGASKPLPKVLDVEFLPQSLIEEWLLARSAGDVSSVLEEVSLVYSSIAPAKRLRYTKDVPKVVKQTLHSLKLDDLAVTVNGLQLLEVVAEDHATEFVPDLSLVFPAIQV
jgi:hypothetical protein